MIHYLRALVARFRGLSGERESDRELGDEIEMHLRLLTERYLRQGMNEAEAASAARRQFGNVTLLREASREMRGIRPIETLFQDLRYGLRMLRKSPGFTLVAVLTLALGIGANTAIFSVVNAVLLRPLPYPEGERLMQLRRRFHPEGGGPVSATKFLFWREHNRTFESMAAFDAVGAGVNLTDGGEPERIRGIRVSADFFRVYGISPALGRSFNPEEERPGGDRVVVVSDGLWRRRFGATPGLLGTSLKLGGEPYTVIGIMAPGFEADRPVDIWIPLHLVAKEQDQANPLLVIGRLKPGVAPEQAQADLDAVAQAFRRQYPALMIDNESIGLHDYRYYMVRDVRTALLIMLGAVGFVLLIANANVAGLLLARAAARQKEMAIRGALGAGRFRLIRQSLTESALLAVIGGALGLLVARWGLQALLALSPANLPRMSEIRLDGGALVFTLAITLSTGILFGLAPAFQFAKSSLNSVLSESSNRASSGIRRSRLRNLIVVMEIGMSLMLLVGAALLIQTFANLRGVDPGFDPHHVLTFKMSLPEAEIDNTARVSNFFGRILQRIEVLPGVLTAAVVTSLPLERTLVLPFDIEGMQDVHHVHWRMISPDYFRTLGIPLRRGRYFMDSDSRSSPAVALINETLARQYFPNRDPIGELITVGRIMGPELADQPRQIVGVVGDVRDGDLMTPMRPGMYVPDSQVPDGMTRLFNRILPVNFVIRTSVDPLSLTAAVRQEVLVADREKPIFNLQPLEQVTADSISFQKFQMLLMGIFATVALFLAAIGIYGVVSYSVSQRTGEIGVRLALGAQPRDVLKLIIGQGLILTLLGTALGLSGALVLTRLMAGLLFGVSATDPLTFAAIALLLTLVTMLASYIPARRAMRVDPVIALRHD